MILRVRWIKRKRASSRECGSVCVRVCVRERGEENSWTRFVDILQLWQNYKSSYLGILLVIFWNFFELTLANFCMILWEIFIAVNGQILKN